MQKIPAAVVQFKQIAFGLSAKMPVQRMLPQTLVEWKLSGSRDHMRKAPIGSHGPG
jgi:hypothetical protein